MNFRKIHFFIALLGLILVACIKENPLPSVASEKGLMVLNEGLFQLNNSSISWIDEETGSVNLNFFEEKTGRQLGDTGNDILRFGNKIYVLVNVSSTIEVLDATTFKSLQQISVTENGVSAQPRFMTAINGEVYFSTFEGKVWCLDTTSLSITYKIKVGLNPDQITNDGNYVYVSNSGGLTPSVYDSTVSIIDPIMKTEIKRIEVGKNPGILIATPNHHVFVITRGNYTMLKPQLHRINTQALERDTTYAIQATHLVNFTADEMLVGVQVENDAIALGKFDFQTEKLKDLNFIPTENVGIIHNLQYSPLTKRIYLMDAGDYTTTGKIWIYHKNGNLLKNYQVGLNPTKVIEFN